MPTADHLRQAGRLLRALAESSPSERDGSSAWYAQAREFQLFIVQQAVPVPHFVYHYLSDADIRVRSESYRSMQQAQVLDVIRQLENGDAAER
jgi:hypothetical protein